MIKTDCGNCNECLYWSGVESVDPEYRGVGVSSKEVKLAASPGGTSTSTLTHILTSTSTSTSTSI